MAIKNLFGRGVGFGAVHWIVTRGYASGVAPPPPKPKGDGGWRRRIVREAEPIRLTAYARHEATATASLVLRRPPVKKVGKKAPKVAPPPEPILLAARTIGKSTTVGVLAKRTPLDDEELMLTVAAAALMLDDEPLAKSSVRRIERERQSVQYGRAELAGTIHAFLRNQVQPIAEQVTALRVEKLAKDDDPTPDVAPILAALTLDWSQLSDDVRQTIERIAREGASMGFTQIGFRASADQVHQANENAIAWARERSAELVGMRWTDNGLIPNPNAEWAITDGTRTLIRAQVAQAEAEGWSSDQLADALSESYGFSEQRSQAIARTELANADIQGNLIAYKASGVVTGKRVLLSSEHDEDDECDDAADMGIVPLEDDFDGLGDPPFHTACECDIEPTLTTDEDEG